MSHNNKNLISRGESGIAMSNSTAKRITAIAEAAMLSDSFRAARTKMALFNAAEVAAAEEYCLERHPSGQAEYRRIVEAHNFKTLKSIVEEGW